MTPELSEAWQQFAAGEFVAVERRLQPLIKAQPTFAHARYLRAMARLAQNKALSALTDLEAIQDAPELSHSVAVTRARALLALGKGSEALKAAKEALDWVGDDGFSHHICGLAHQMCGDPAAALKAFRRAVLLQPDLAAAHYELGSCALSEGQIDEAISALQKAAQYWPDQAAVANNLGLALAEAGRWSEAEAELRRAVTRNVRYAEGWFNLARILKAQEQHEAANECHQKAVKLRSDLRNLPW